MTPDTLRAWRRLAAVAGCSVIAPDDDDVRARRVATCVARPGTTVTSVRDQRCVARPDVDVVVRLESAE